MFVCILESAFYLICDAYSLSRVWIRMLVASCKCYVFVSCVHPVAVLEAAFCKVSWFAVCLCQPRM